MGEDVEEGQEHEKEELLSRFIVLGDSRLTAQEGQEEREEEREEELWECQFDWGYCPAFSEKVNGHDDDDTDNGEKDVDDDKVVDERQEDRRESDEGDVTCVGRESALSRISRTNP